MRTLHRTVAILLFVALLIPSLAGAEEEECTTPAILLGSWVNGSILTVAVRNPKPDPLEVYIVARLEISGEVTTYASLATASANGITIFDLDYEDPISVVVSLSLSGCLPPDAPTEGPDPIGRSPLGPS